MRNVWEIFKQEMANTGQGHLNLSSLVGSALVPFANVIMRRGKICLGGLFTFGH